MVAAGALGIGAFLLAFLVVGGRGGGTSAPALAVAVERPAPEPPPPPPTLPAFDEASLVNGGDGEQGAILAGPGIVGGSGDADRTPWELIIPSALLRARLVKVGLNWDGALGAPDNPEVIGWWKDGALPGEAGNVLLNGHRDYRDIYDTVGTGVCWLLPDTQPGDPVIVRDWAARLHYLYEVTETTAIAWDDPAGVDYLQPTVAPTLTLITCEGSFDREASNYSDRRVVVAVLVGAIPFSDDAAPASP